MRKYLISCMLLMLSAAAAFGQDDKEEIKKTFESYFLNLSQKNNEGAMEYIYPKLFEIVPKEAMLQAMNSMAADTTTTITIENARVESISDNVASANVKYALIKYGFRLTMVMNHNKSLPDSTEEESFNSADFTYEMLKENYGADNVAYDKENSSFVVNVSNEAYAILDPAYPGWKFLDKKDSMKPLLQKLLPKQVMKKL